MDDGKRSDALGVSLLQNSLYKGRGPGRGWWRSDLCWRLVDFFSRVWEGFFLVFFSKLFFTSFFKGFSWILEGFRSPKLVPKPILGVFFAMFFRRASWDRFFCVFESFF